MKRLLSLATLVFLTAGCTSDSDFPSPTGKGAVRAFNAVEGSPDVSLRIEETLLDTISYKQVSASRRWDDFQYTFKFETFFAGESTARQIASTALTVEADVDYTLVLTGNLDAPDITIWQSPERSFSETETVFEARFAHTAASLGSIDVYFAAPGIAPAVGTERGTLNFGEILDAVDIEAGDYVLRFTAAGDPATVLFESEAVSYTARDAFIAPIVDGDGTDVAPFDVGLISTSRGALSLSDARFGPTIRFFQASQDLPPADVYDDESLTNQVLSNHIFGDISGDIEVSAGATGLTYTAAGNTGAIQFEDSIVVAAGTHTNYILIGAEGSRQASAFIPDRRSVSTGVQLQVFPASLNHQTIDLYVVDAGATIDGETRLGSLSYGLPTGNIPLTAGSYDVYLTVLDETTLLSGPTRIDVHLGDVIEAIVLDVTDPAVAEFRIVPAP